MSYGHADHLARSGHQPGVQQTPAADPPPEPATPASPSALAPDWYTALELAPILTGRDIRALYRWLSNAGMAQRRIAALTATTQPQVADIISGRRARVMVYDVLVRITEGLGIPRERLGLSYWGPDGTWHGPASAYARGATVAGAPKWVSAEMLRRHLIAWGGIVMTGAPVHTLGELLDDLGDPPPVASPSRLHPAHVAHVENLRQSLEKTGWTFGADPAMSSAAAARAERLLTVPGAEPLKRALQAAVAHLHIHAGSAAFDAGLYERTLHHLARGVDLARQAHDPFLQA
ncbi:MAG TPA: hypothetical protein VFQ77_06570, partial [Pseudonocardiaceae bacterium]|nr:hypothetical protein [Pseudonocardiaceae bacterium]